MATTMMPAPPTGKCQKKLKSCPPGHEVEACDSDGENRCSQCGNMYFQPNENRLGDKCRLRKICVKPFMEYRDYGSTVNDAQCQCIPGYHFENEDQRACVPNRECDKGFGQGEFGVCENCIQKMMYSDTRDRRQKCKPLRNCEKESRCTKEKSNGTFDNKCGPLVRDINDCSTIVSEPEGGDSTLKTGLICGGVALLVIFIILLITLWLHRRNTSRKRKRQQEHVTTEQLDEIRRLILHKCEKDEDLSKKVISESFSLVESRIDRQYWRLAQFLFKNHHITGKYEVLVETYKDKCAREIVRGYLSEWRVWRGDNQAAVEELFMGLHNSGRDDIIYEICNNLRSEIGEVYYEGEEKSVDKHTSNRAEESFFCDIGDWLPCMRRQETMCDEQEESPESRNKLLEVQAQADSQCLPVKGGGAGGGGGGGPVCEARTYPSAPTLEENNGLLTEGDVQFHRQYSQPVQATT